MNTPAITDDIWLVEDHAPLRETLREALAASCGGGVSAFPSCEAALAACGAGRALPEVLILDLGLPGMSGVEGIKHFKIAVP